MSLDVDALYRRYGGLVHRRCARLLRDDDAARDVTQEVFLAVWRARERLDETSPASLLLRVATNLSLNRLRSLRRYPVVGVELGTDERSRTVTTDERPGECSIARQLLTQLFGDEPASTRRIAVLRHLDGHTHEEVAEQVGLSVSGVRLRLRTLKARLEALDSSGDSAPERLADAA